MQQINIYCDESCHLRNENIDVMAIGSVYCLKDNVNKIKQIIRDIKIKYNFDKEIKWSKISLKYLEMYKELINSFANSNFLFYRAVVIENKHTYYFKDTDDYNNWYYKMYYQLLNKIVENNNYYKIYIDRKDKKGKEKTEKLRRILSYQKHDFNLDFIEEICIVDSDCNDLVQIADLFTGMMTYYYRGLHLQTNSDRAKKELIKTLTKKVDLNKATSLSRKSFNVFRWRGRNGIK